MISSFFILAIKIIAVVALLVGMVVILTGIGHLTNRRGENDINKTGNLRAEINKSEKVISPNSVFHNFLVVRKK